LFLNGTHRSGVLSFPKCSQNFRAGLFPDATQQGDVQINEGDRDEGITMGSGASCL
jgi:hypothetical protein